MLAARWEGTSIQPGATVPVGIACIVDDALLSSESFDLTQAEYVAIGMAKVSGPPFLAEGLGQALSAAGRLGSQHSNSARANAHETCESTDEDCRNRQQDRKRQRFDQSAAVANRAERRRVMPQTQHEADSRDAERRREHDARTRCEHCGGDRSTSRRGPHPAPRLHSPRSPVDSGLRRGLLGHRPLRRDGARP